MDGSSSLSHHGTREQVVELDSESDSDSNQDSDDGTQPVGLDEEQRKRNLSEATNAGEGSVLLQIQQMEIVDPSGCVKELIMKNPKEDTRWGEICQKI
ncbi:unnamed protein product [Sphagnum jensenii]|uniref:Uncharacterized protein n=1 Tax=Sphagnum jensenii TaxID=128206 RepID=A0ABP1A6D7_9BRYO